jgi:hypothetical protein
MRRGWDDIAMGALVAVFVTALAVLLLLMAVLLVGLLATAVRDVWGELL